MLFRLSDMSYSEILPFPAVTAVFNSYYIFTKKTLGIELNVIMKVLV